MQVAIVSSDGIHVDEHFGRAERFLIYEIEGARQTLLAIRVFAPYSDGDRKHEFDADRFAQVTDKLSGCERLYCTGIGDKPAAELLKLGIEPLIFQGAILNISV